MLHSCVQVKCQSDGLAAAAVLQQLFSKGGPSALKALYAGAVVWRDLRNLLNSSSRIVSWKASSCICWHFCQQRLEAS
jgi:hypothetical protein